MKYAEKERRFISPTEKCENLYEKKKELFLSTITKYEESDQKKNEKLNGLIHDQVSYIFGDCTIKKRRFQLLMRGSMLNK